MRACFVAGIWVPIALSAVVVAGCSSSSGQDGGDAADDVAVETDLDDDRPLDDLGGYGDEWPTEGEPSATLISGALASGELDFETAFVYRVLAAFRDTRLPPAYRGYDAAVPDSLIGTELAARYTDLSAENQALLQPYLIPPIYEGSWYDLRETGAPWPTASSETSSEKAREPGQPPPCQRRLSRLPWVSIDRDHVRVWYPDIPIYQRYLDGYVAFADAIEGDAWAPLTALMGRSPLDDQALLPDDYECDGEDGRLDVYFASLGPGAIVSSFADIPCAPAPTFIQAAPTDDVAALRRTAAHELMHVLQFTYNVRGECLSIDLDQLWWGEATALWAEAYVFPDPSFHVDTHSYAARYLSAPERALHDVSDLNQAGYTAWLFPLFMEHEYSADLIALSFTRWEQAANAAEAVNRTVPGGWRTQFPIFTTYNLNEPPVDHYTQWHAIDSSAQPLLEVGLVKGQSRELPQPAVRSLAYHVYRFDVPDNTRLLDFDNTWHREGLDDIQVRALLGRGGRLSAPEDWTQQKRVMLCSDNPSVEEVDELALVVSNTSHGDPTEAIGPTLPPYVAAWDVPCWRLVGTSRYDWESIQTVSNPYGSATTTVRREGVAENVTLEVLDVDPTWPLPRGSFEFRPTEGEFTWSGEIIYEIEEAGEPPVRVECTLEPVTAAISQADGFIAIVPEGAPGVFGSGYSGMGTTEVGLSTSHCDSRIPPSTIDPEFATWFATDATYFPIPSSGTLADDVSVTEDLGTTTVEWSSEWRFRVP